MLRFIRTAFYGSVATVTFIDIFGYVAKVEGMQIFIIKLIKVIFLIA